MEATSNEWQTALTQLNKTQTVGNVSISDNMNWGGTLESWHDYHRGRRYNDYYRPQIVQQWPTIVTPTQCAGELHVFGCEHAEKCKCGKASRIPEPKKCACCGAPK